MAQDEGQRLKLLECDLQALTRHLHEQWTSSLGIACHRLVDLWRCITRCIIKAPLCTSSSARRAIDVQFLSASFSAGVCSTWWFVLLEATAFVRRDAGSEHQKAC